MGNSTSTMRHGETTVTLDDAPVRGYRAGADGRPTLVLLHGDGPDAAQAVRAPVWPVLTRTPAWSPPTCPGAVAAPRRHHPDLADLRAQASIRRLEELREGSPRFLRRDTSGASTIQSA